MKDGDFIELLEEYKEIMCKIRRGFIAYYGDKITDETARKMLLSQLNAMLDYSYKLNARIIYHAGEGNAKF